MDEQQRRTLFCLSALLRYPDEAMRANVHDIRTSMRRKALPLPSPVSRFMDYADTAHILQLQDTYLQTFCASTGICLHLTKPACHDTPHQQHALAYLSQIYRDAGYAPLPGEPADYLPLLLEFMAWAPDWVGAYLCEEFFPVLEQMAGTAAHLSSPYAELVCTAAEIMREQCSQYKKM